MIIKFNVFGKAMSVHRKEHQWHLYNESATGLRSRVYDVVIPSELEATQLGQYLDDIYHEYASEKHPSVVKVG